MLVAPSLSAFLEKSMRVILQGLVRREVDVVVNKLRRVHFPFVEESIREVIECLGLKPCELNMSHVRQHNEASALQVRHELLLHILHGGGEVEITHEDQHLSIDARVLTVFFRHDPDRPATPTCRPPEELPRWRANGEERGQESLLQRPPEDDHYWSL